MWFSEFPAPASQEGLRRAGLELSGNKKSITGTVSILGLSSCHVQIAHKSLLISYLEGKCLAAMISKAKWKMKARSFHIQYSVGMSWPNHPVFNTEPISYKNMHEDSQSTDALFILYFVINLKTSTRWRRSSHQMSWSKGEDLYNVILISKDIWCYKFLCLLRICCVNEGGSQIFLLHALDSDILGL